MPPRTIWDWSLLPGTSSPPDLFETGGEGRMPSVNGVGEPCAGEPHARIEVAGIGNGAENQVTDTGMGQPTGKPTEHQGPRSYNPAKQPRQSPTLLDVPRGKCTTVMSKPSS